MLWMKATATRLAEEPVMVTEVSTEMPARLIRSRFLPKLLGVCSVEP